MKYRIVARERKKTFRSPACRYRRKSNTCPVLLPTAEISLEGSSRALIPTKIPLSDTDFRGTAKRRKKGKLRAFCRACSLTLRKKGELALRRMAGTAEELSRMAGVLCAALAVTFLTGAVLLLALFGRYNRPSTEITVPNYVGGTIEPLMAESTEPISLVIQYEYNAGYTEGAVISQSPAPGVTRRLYGSEDRLTVTLTVCRKKPLFTLPSLAGMSRRDASLLLRSAGMTVTVREEYAEAVPQDTVLRAEPGEGEHIPVGSEVEIVVSLGKKETSVSVPDLLLLSESAARSVLESAGLSAGRVSYVASELPAGCVISQSVSAGQQKKQGAQIDFSVSLGQVTALRSMPDLFGLTVEQAKAKLREVGLTVGSISTAAHATAPGTVLAQSIAAGTLITSSVTSVDLTVSQ